MQIIVHGTPAQQAQWQTNQTENADHIAWVFEKVQLLQTAPADAVIDLLFEATPQHIAFLQQLPGVKIINSVVHTLAEVEASFIRINGWNTFLAAPVLEASCRHEHLKKFADTVFQQFGKTAEWLPDEPGFVVPRVVSMIVNEAYFALAEEVSTRTEIDTAMQLGTAYPYGPFTWSKKIGLENIVGLLTKLSATQSRYTPAPQMLAEARLI